MLAAACFVDHVLIAIVSQFLSTRPGAGRPAVTVWGNSLACLIVGAPLAYWFAFQLQAGLLGLWAAMACAWTAATIVYGVVIFGRTDWAAEVDAARERNETALRGREAATDVAL